MHTRIRRHQIPEYIEELINKTDPSHDELIQLSGDAIYKRFMRLLKKNGIPHISFHDLRHLIASIMALLRIPNRYAMERGGWKTDKVMKKVYTHTFSDEREKVDAVIDNCFESVMKSTKNDVDIKKYKAWLMLYDKTEGSKSLDEFKSFIQHEIQHKKRPLITQES